MGLIYDEDTAKRIDFQAIDKIQTAYSENSNTSGESSQPVTDLWGHEEIATQAGWETLLYEIPDDVVLTTIVYSTFGITSLRIVVGNLATGLSIRSVSGSGAKSVSIPIPNASLKNGTKLITYVYLGNPANDAIHVSYIGYYL